jgi:hypothetical protein
MPVTYLAALRTDRLRLVLNDLGTATAPTISTTGTLAGSLVIGTSALSGATGVLATVTLPTTPASVTGDVLTLLGVPLTATASATGTAAKAELRDNAGNAIVTGLTVTASGGGGDVIISSVAITSGQTVQVNSGTITHPV